LPGRFDTWIAAHRHLIRDLLYAPFDFLRYVGEREAWGYGENIWIYTLNGFVTCQTLRRILRPDFQAGSVLRQRRMKRLPKIFRREFPECTAGSTGKLHFNMAFAGSIMRNLGEGSDELFTEASADQTQNRITF